MDTSFLTRCLLIFATSAGFTPVLRAQGKEGRPHFYDGVQVICIGINNHFLPALNLKNAVADAEAFAEVAEKDFGFATKLLRNKDAKKQLILNEIEELDRRANPPEAVILYFACHGISFEHAPKGKPAPTRVGFFVPQDADVDLNDTSDLDKWEENAINMRTLVDRIERMKCRHVVLIADTCCSGYLTKRGLESREITALLSDSSRTILAATTQNQAAYDDGAFTGELVGILKQAARDAEPLSASDVWLKLRSFVAKKAGTKMTPQMAHIGVGDGEFIFIPRSINEASVLQLKDAVAEVRKGGKLDIGKVRGFAEILERKQKLLGRRSHPADIIPAMEAPDYRFGADAETSQRTWGSIHRRFQENAEYGDVWAMAGLHLCYAKGLGVEKSAKEAHYWAQRADLFTKPAGVGRFLLGRCYESGVGVVKNDVTARSLYTESANQGNAFGKWALADATLRSGPAADDARHAVELLTSAHEAGVIAATTELGKLFTGLRSASGVPRDFAKGMKLLEEAAKKESANAQFQLSQIIALDRENQKADKKLALDWLKKSAEQGDAAALAHLARALCYDPQEKNSYGAKRDYRLALGYAELAARQGAPEGDLLLAQLYHTGLAGKVDFALARKHVETASSAGLAEADWLRGFWIMRRECGYTLDATRSVDVYVQAIARDPQMKFLETPFYLTPRPSAFPDDALARIRNAPQKQRLLVIHQAVVQDMINRVRMINP